MKTMYFITGVNGVGKTSVIKPLKSLLGPQFEIHDFDERGVPNNVGRQWRLDETKYWIELGLVNSKKRLVTVVCGFARPSEVGEDPSVGFVLLDADEKTIQTRLESRHSTPETIKTIEDVSGKTVQQFISDNVTFSATMRDEATQYGVDVIDTTHLTLEQVAERVAKILS